MRLSDVKEQIIASVIDQFVVTVIDAKTKEWNPEFIRKRAEGSIAVAQTINAEVANELRRIGRALGIFPPLTLSVHDDPLYANADDEDGLTITFETCKDPDCHCSEPCAAFLNTLPDLLVAKVELLPIVVGVVGDECDCEQCRAETKATP